MSSCLPSSSSDLSFLPFGWFDTSLCYCRVQFSKARLMFEELKYWFVKTWGICWSTVVKAVPSCGGDYLRRQVQELHALMTSFISDFGCIIFMFMFSLVLSINSPNATSLHSRCIWEGVLDYICVKGSLVTSYILGFGVSHVLYIYCPLGLYQYNKHPFVTNLTLMSILKEPLTYYA